MVKVVFSDNAKYKWNWTRSKHSKGQNGRQPWEDDPKENYYARIRKKKEEKDVSNKSL